jgi:hypothetical protein
MERVNYGQRLPLFAEPCGAFAADAERFVARHRSDGRAFDATG